jgi:GTPase SAR1 family protein
MSQLPAGLFQLKTVLLGSSSVGKSSIALRFSKDQFFSEIDNTIGGNYSKKTFEFIQRIDLVFFHYCHDGTTLNSFVTF